MPNYLSITSLINSLTILLGFTITLNTASSYSIMALIIILTIINKQATLSLQQLIRHPLALSFFALFFLHLIGLLWTEDINAGLKILSKQKIYLFAVMLLFTTSRETAKYTLIALITAIIFSEFHLFYLYLFATDLPNSSALSHFMNHMHYSLVLCFIFGYLISQLDLTQLYKPSNYLLLGLALLTLTTLLINSGRIGQITLPIVLMVLAVWKFKLPFFKSTLLVSILISLLFTLAYHYSEAFNKRANQAWYEINETIGKDKRASISCRFEMWQHSYELGSKNPLIGVGTGDSITEMTTLLNGKSELDKLYKECGLKIKYQLNPHNNFALIYMQFGALGLIVLIGAMLAQLQYAIRTQSLPLFLLLTVTLAGMMTASPISMHVKYMFFYTITSVLLTRYHRPTTPDRYRICN